MWIIIIIVYGLFDNVNLFEESITLLIVSTSQFFEDGRLEFAISSTKSVHCLKKKKKRGRKREKRRGKKKRKKLAFDVTSLPVKFLFGAQTSIRGGNYKYL